MRSDPFTTIGKISYRPQQEMADRKTQLKMSRLCRQPRLYPGAGSVQVLADLGYRSVSFPMMAFES